MSFKSTFTCYDNLVYTALTEIQSTDFCQTLEFTNFKKYKSHQDIYHCLCIQKALSLYLEKKKDNWLNIFSLRNTLITNNKNS